MLNNLEDILKMILKKIEDNSELLELAISNLNTKRNVARCLNKSIATIDNYVRNGTLIEDKHYFINKKGKIEFIPTGILEFKSNPIIKKKNGLINDLTITHKAVSNILKGVRYG